MSFEQLKKLFNETQKDIISRTENFNWDSKSNYVSWLKDTFVYAENSTRILAIAGGMMPQDKRVLSNRFIAHAAEEKNHDLLLVNDIKNLGFDINEIEPTQEMQIYARSLSYWIAPGGNPVGLIGWVLSLEGLAATVGPIIYDKVNKKFGSKASAFLKVHAEEDPDHLEKALNATKNLSEEDLKIVCDSLKMYTNQYIKVLDAIEASNTEVKAA